MRCAARSRCSRRCPSGTRGVGAENRIELRIGINLGDVIVDGDDLYGDGVNIAARIEALADAGGVFVSNTVYDQVRDRLPFVFEDLGEQQVKNIARPVRVYRVRELARSQEPIVPVTPALPLPDKPSIAVLPFANMSGDPEQQYFADGMVEEIITALSRIRWLFVIARNSSFTYKGQAVDVKRVGREFGVRYALEGSVRKAGGRVRITGQLIDALSGTHLWADRFDGSLEDVFGLQDQVASGVAGAIEPRLRQSEIERASRRPTESLDAYDLYLRALALRDTHTDESVREAVALLKRALAVDPGYAPAKAAIGWSRVHQVSRTAASLETEPPEAVSLARQALEAGKDDPDTLWWLPPLWRFCRGARNCGERLIDRALMLNPIPPMRMGTRFRMWQSRPIRTSDRSLRARDAAEPARSPPQKFHHRDGLRPFGGGPLRQALDWAERTCDEEPGYRGSLETKVIACAHLAQMGRLERATESSARGATPGSRSQGTVHSGRGAAGTIDHLLDGLRKARVAGE